MRLSGPITTVDFERLPVKLPARAKVRASTGKWFTESSWVDVVVHGNHPFSVRRMVSGTGVWREVAVRSELNLGPLA